MSLYLAVDAGSTKTECVVADESQVLARLRGPSVKVPLVSAPEAATRLRRLLTEVSEQAGVPLYLVTRACMGLSGIGADGVRAWVEAVLREQLTGELILLGDEEIALEAAFDDGPGVLVLAGTGSHVIGRCSDGTRFTAGGWGSVLGDEGSGYWIGLEGIRTGLRALDRGVPSRLLRDVQAAWGLNGLGALVAKANALPRPDFSQLAPTVAASAAAGDKLAANVLLRAGEELAAQVQMVLARMRSAACAGSDGHRVAFTGSVLTHVAPVREAMVAALRREYAGIQIDGEAVSAVEGALARARRD